MEQPSFLRKVETELPYDTVIPLLRICPEEMKSAFERDTCNHIVIEAQITMAEICKQPRCLSAEKWTIEVWYIYTHDGILLGNKKNENLTSATKGYNWRSVC